MLNAECRVLNDETLNGECRVLNAAIQHGIRLPSDFQSDVQRYETVCATPTGTPVWVWVADGVSASARPSSMCET